MTGDESNRVLYIIACPGVGTLIGLAQAEGWCVYVIATPSAMAFLDLDAIEAQLGGPVFSQYRQPSEPKRQPPADAAVVAPGTYNTINKWAAGIADNYALGTLAELTGQGVPIALLPFVNDNLAANRVYARSLDELRDAGVRVLHSPRHTGEGDPLLDNFPWQSALDAVR